VESFEAIVGLGPMELGLGWLGVQGLSY